jgi:hypothetical protein
MPNINLYDVYNRKRAKFGINDSTNFRQYFLDALNIVYSELNEKVFEAATLEPLNSFDDIIDNRLAGFTSLTFNASSNAAIESREFWSVEYDFERLSLTNGFTDTITDDSSNVVISITNGVVSIAGGSVACSATIPSTTSETFSLSFVSDKDGNRIMINGGSIEATYTTGNSETTQPIGAISSHVISGVSGLDFLRTRFLSAGSLIYDFLLNEESLKSGETDILVDEIASYEMTTIPDPPVFESRYIEPSTGLDFRYRSALEMGLDYHLQDGGQFGLEPEPERERKWYGRGIRSARQAFSQQSTYKSPLNPSGA